MVENGQFLAWLTAWLAGFGVVLWAQRRSSSGVGLVLAYALQLWVIHWLAPSIYALPWYAQPTPILLSGLQQSTYAIWGFAIGCGVIMPLVSRRAAGDDETPGRATLADPWLMGWCLAIGVAAYIVQPAVRSIPTVGGLVSLTPNLLLVAFAMESWNGLHGPRRSIWRWIGGSALLPFVTIVTQGFLSYGFAAMLTVFAFVASIYRPRWKVVVSGLLVSYLALSMYVTYMRDRQAIRAVVWAAEAYSRRLQAVTDTFVDFEFLNLNNIEHLQRIDDRLNQNNLVGMAVAYLASRPTEFGRGETIWDALLAPIPRALWPDRPIAAGSGDLVTRFTGIRFNENTSVGIGHVMEWYVNFGALGVFFGSLLFGIGLAAIDRAAATRVRSGDWSRFVMFYLPALSLLQVGGSLVEAVSGASGGLVIAFIFHQVRPVRLRHQEAHTLEASPEPLPEDDLALGPAEDLALGPEHLS